MISLYFKWLDIYIFLFPICTLSLSNACLAPCGAPLGRKTLCALVRHAPLTTLFVSNYSTKTCRFIHHPLRETTLAPICQTAIMKICSERIKSGEKIKIKNACNRHTALHLTTQREGGIESIYPLKEILTKTREIIWTTENTLQNTSSVNFIDMLVL